MELYLKVRVACDGGIPAQSHCREDVGQAYMRLLDREEEPA